MQRAQNEAQFEAWTRGSRAPSSSKAQLSALELLAMFLVLLLLLAGCQAANQPAPIRTAAAAPQPAPIEPLGTNQRVPWSELTAGSAQPFEKALLA